MAFVTHEENGLVWLTASHLDACSGVAHGFSTRLGGVSRPPFDTLNLGISRGDERQALEENYRRFCAAIGTDVRRVVCSRQVHGDLIHEAVEEDAGRGLWQSRDYDNDAFITDVPGLALTVFSADCGTVLLYDPVHRAIGAVHAGWRGVANGIAKKTIEAMTVRYDTQPKELLAAMGPSICADCFENSNIQRCLDCGELFFPDGLDARSGYCRECSDANTWWCCECTKCFQIEGMAEIAPGFFLCGPCTQDKLLELGYDGTVAWIVENPNFGPRE